MSDLRVSVCKCKCGCAHMHTHGHTLINFSALEHTDLRVSACGQSWALAPALRPDCFRSYSEQEEAN